MLRKVKKIDPQLHFVEQSRPALILPNKIKLSLYKKSANSGISVNILEEVFCRGYLLWNKQFKGTQQQFAFDRVNSFIAGGFAADLDKDLVERSIKAPINEEIIKTHNTPLSVIKKTIRNRDHVYVESKNEEPHSKNKNDSSSRFDGSSEVVAIYSKDTPGQPTIGKKVLNRVRKYKKC